jgi:hypothetical protein
MLYDRWQHIARTHRHELALRDCASDRAWTFADLAAETEKGSSGAEQIVFPQGHTATFILAVLRGWRENQIVCPLEPGQAPPLLGRDALPRTQADRQVSSTNKIIHQIVADMENVVATMGLRRDWPNLGVISLAHSYGFSNLVTPLLLHGIPLILAPAPLPETVRQAAAFAAHLTLPAVPAMWRAWHVANAIPPNVRLAISAGAPLPLALEQEIFAQCGLSIAHRARVGNPLPTWVEDSQLLRRQRMRRHRLRRQRNTAHRRRFRGHVHAERGVVRSRRWLSPSPQPRRGGRVFRRWKFGDGRWWKFLPQLPTPNS